MTNKKNTILVKKNIENDIFKNLGYTNKQSKQLLDIVSNKPTGYLMIAGITGSGSSLSFKECLKNYKIK